MFRITADFLRRTKRCLRLTKDILLIPRMEPTREDTIALRNMAISDKNVLKIFPDYQQERIHCEQPREIMWTLKRLYLGHCKDFTEKLAGKRKEKRKWRDPAWMSRLPDSVQAALRYEAVYSKRYSQSNLIHGYMNPYLGFVYILHMDGRVGDLFHAARLCRQYNHPQLSNKCDPVSSQLDFGFWTRRSPQTRIMHEEGAYVLNTVVAFNLRNHLSPHQRRSFSASGLVHDSQMPLLGDEVMEIDPVAFCEVTNIHNLFKNYAWSEKREKYGLSNKFIAQAVRGEGTPGDLQDKTDRIEYTALDAKNLVEVYYGSPYQQKIPWLRKLCELVRLNPDLFAVWDCIYMRDGKVFFTDPIRVGDFLTVRATMFRNVYYGEHTRSTGTILTKTVVAYQYARGILKRDDFFILTLEEIDTRIGEFVGDRNIMRSGDRPGNPRVETFTTLEEAYRREKELFDRGIVLSAIEDCRGKINPATHFLVQTPDGKILPFSEAYPKKTEIIHEIAAMSRPIYLMYLQNLHIPLDSYLQLRKFKREQFAQRGQLI